MSVWGKTDTKVKWELLFTFLIAPNSAIGLVQYILVNNEIGLTHTHLQIIQTATLEHYDMKQGQQPSKFLYTGSKLKRRECLAHWNIHLFYQLDTRTDVLTKEPFNFPMKAYLRDVDESSHFSKTAWSDRSTRWHFYKCFIQLCDSPPTSSFPKPWTEGESAAELLSCFPCEINFITKAILRCCFPEVMSGEKETKKIKQKLHS